MRAWIIFMETEQHQQMPLRAKSLYPTAMEVEEPVVVNSESILVQIMDDNETKGRDPVLDPSFTPGIKPALSELSYKEHKYNVCKCHLNLREYGQDESIYRPGDHPTSQWGYR